MNKTGKRIAVSLLGILCTVGIAGGVSACKSKSNPMAAPENATTMRLVAPNDGSTPIDHEAIDNIGYIAYVLDNQQFYHAYARNSTKSMGYEQITQTWKDYKSAALSGIGESVMICSDISYSTLSKSALQICSVGAYEAYTRSGSKPGKNTTANTEAWSQSAPTYYDKDTYYHKYGEFSTELSVYVVNDETIGDIGEVVAKEDGTYEISFTLNSQAGCWYQYKMKTNGSLKKYPEFQRISMTLNFDSSWRILSTYCEEKIEITPSALGGIPMTSTSKTTTTFYYGEEDFDNEHFANFDNYFKQYLGTRPGPSGTEEETLPSLTDLLGAGFNKVVDPNGNGQQFNLALTLGDTEYTGKVYAKLTSMEDILGSLDVRVALEKKGSGQQDLYIEFNNGAVNAYYSDEFAMTVNIGSVGTVINQFKDWINNFTSSIKTASAANYSLAEDAEEENSAIAALLAELKQEFTDDSAYVTLTTDNLMGTGIGVNLRLEFNRTNDGDGDSYSFRSASINSITYDETSIKLSASVLPDESGAAIISRTASSTAADLADYMTGVYNMLNSNTLKVDLKLDGSGANVISALKGADAAVTAYLALGNELSLKTDISASYNGVSAKLSAYYALNLSNGGYGVVYLNLTEINGKAMDAKIRCNIDETVNAVKQLISSISGAQGASVAAYSEEAASSLAEIINNALCLDFGKVLGDIYASNSQIRLSINLDEIINALNLNVGGLNFGTAALALTNGNTASFSASLPALGFTASVSGSAQTVSQPAANDYLDVAEIISLVKTAADEAHKIISAEDIAFNIDATVIIDDVPLAVKGSGEVVWADGNIKVALDLYLSVADGTSVAANKDSVELKLVYDSSASGTAPLAVFTVNSLGMRIYQSDLDSVKADIENIINSVKSLTDSNKTGNATPEEAVELLSSAYGAARSGAGEDILSILTSGNVQNVLKTVLGFVSDITSVELEYNAAEEVSGLVIRHAVNGSLSLGANGNLSLALEINDNNGTRIIDGSAAVAVGNGSAFAALNEEFANGGYTFYTTAEAESAFTKVVYDYLFAVIEDIGIADVLGGKTYTVQLTLDGAKSEIPALQDITVNASIYYTEGLDGDKIVSGKLAEIDLDLSIGGVPVSLNVRYNAGYVYVDLRTIDNLSLTDIMVKADAQDIYSVCGQVVDLITGTDILNLISGKTQNEEAVAALSLAREGETKTSLTGVLAKLFSLDFNAAFSYKKVDGVNTATVQTDYVLNHLGVAPAYAIGTITVGVNPETHRIAADITLNGEKWISAYAEAAERRVYEENWQNGYIDISFVSVLLSDLTKTAFDGGVLNTLYTLTGDIVIDISAINIINISFNISNVKLTAGLDEDGEFYVTLTGRLSKSTYMWQTVTKEMDISVTYSRGYITLGRQNDSGEYIYKVMTLEFFLDNIFDSNNSPVRWLLGTDSTPWGLVCKAINANIDSGLTKPESLYLYNQTQKPKEDKFFALGDILSGLSVNVDGKKGGYNDGSAAVNKWNLTDNYYALNINAKELTGGTVSTLYAALLRDDEKGITGLRLFASVAGALDVNVKLDDLTTDRAAAAPDYLKNINVDFDRYAGAIENTSTHTTSIFGCYSTETDTYESSEVLSTVTLTVTGYEGVFEEQVIELRYGSTVYLTNSFSPIWANEEHTLKLEFTDIDGNELGSHIVLTDDILDENRNFTLLTVAAEVVEVNFYIGYGNIGTVNSALFYDEELTAYDREISGLKFIGWYNDEAMTEKVTSVDEITNFVNGVRTVYAKYIAEVETVNGVIYTFTADETEIGGSYAITGYDAEKIAPYTVEGSWLILENELYSVPVTSIAESAFAEASLKNVLIPENIVTIGAQAFLDNYSIETVVITADTVMLKGSGSTCVFYGCSLNDGGVTTKLNVYVNSVNCEADRNRWTYFRKDGDRYIEENGGSVTTAGSWTFVKYEYADNAYGLALDCIYDGIKTEAQTEAQIEAAILAEINGKTAKNGYINAYSVKVDNRYDLNGKLVDVSISITDEDNFWYALTVTDVNGFGAKFGGDYVTTFNGVRYAMSGSKVTLSPADGYAFTDVPSGVYCEEDGEGYVFTMPENAVDLTVNCKEVGITQTTLISAIDYTYNGAPYTVEDPAIIEVLEDTILSAPVAEGYVFVGWAYDDNGTLVFKDSDEIKYGTYYAIWAGEKQGVTFGIAEDKRSVTATPTDATVYGWYDNAALSGDALHSSEISLSNTVMYVRLNFTFTLTWSGTPQNHFYITSMTVQNPSDGKLVITMTVLENTSISVKFDTVNASNANYYQYCTITYNNVDTVIYGFKWDRKNIFSSYEEMDARYFKLDETVFNGGWSEITTGGNEVYTGIANVTGNISIVSTY